MFGTPDIVCNKRFLLYYYLFVDLKSHKILKGMATVNKAYQVSPFLSACKSFAVVFLKPVSNSKHYSIL